MAKVKRVVQRALSVALAVLVVSGVLGGLVACGDGNSSPTAMNGEKRLHAGSTTYFYAESMDPASDWDSWYLTYYGIMETLFRVSDDLTAEPWLAQDAVTEDGLTWQVSIKDGISFSNGMPVDAAAVKAAWERTYETNIRATETLPLVSIEAAGQILTVTTQAVVPGFENILCDPLLCVYYVGDEVSYKENTFGTGPYKKTEFVAEDHIVMEPNELYWNGTPKLDQIELTTFSDDNALTMAMQTGEIDAVAMPSASALATLSAGDYVVSTRTTSRADFIRLNMTHPLLQNSAVRTALAYCIDREGYAEVICQGSSSPSWGVYSPTLPFGGTEGLTVAVHQFDIAAANDVLDAAGMYDKDGDGVRELNGTPLAIDLYVCTNYERFVREADDLRSNLAKAGIQLTIVPTDYFLEDPETFAADNPDMTLDSYAMAPTGNQAYFANMSFATGASNNLGGYSNAQVDALIAQLDQTYGEDERDALARSIAQIVLDDLPYIFFANTQACVITTPGVIGLDAAPSEYYFITVEADVA